MRRILISLGMIVFVGAVAAGATGAFFSDTETSSGNTFAAGAIDLKIDNTSYVTNNAGNLVASPNNTWTLADLTNQLFFSFTDVKPGDIGEDTISVHAGSNDAWACMAAKLTSTPDNGIVDPETTAGDVTDGSTGGELQNFLNFAFWNDDGDNVYETGEGQITQLTGPASDIFNGSWLPLADSGTGTPIPGNSTRYIGKAWCFGTLTANPATQDGNGSSTPLTRQTTGFTCDGSGDNNIAQTDGISVDVSFQAVQARNNGQFLCSSLPAFTGGLPAPVGALLSAYVAPTGEACNGGTVSGSQSVQTAINAASAGQTVCVDPSYDGTGDNSPIAINKDNLTLAGLGTAGAATLDQGVIIDNDGGKVTGLTLGLSTTLGETFSVYVNSGVDNAVVSYDQATGSGAPSRGVVNALGTTNNLLVSNSKFTGFATGVYLNDSSNMVVEHNTLTGNAVGISADHPNNSSITFNTIKNNTFEGIGTLVAAADSIAIHNNNIYTNNAGTLSNLDNYDGTGTVDATNNWWGGPAAVGINAQGGSAGTVNTAPVSPVAHPEN